MRPFTQLIFLCLLLSIKTIISQTVVCNPSALESNWQLLGPKSDLVYNNIGRVTAIWVDSEDNNYILAGTRGSGLWRTLDGGTTWNNLTGYQLPATGIYSIDVKKVGANRSIYCSTLFNGSSMNLHGLGLIYSDDDGLTWTRETTFPGGIAPFRLFGNVNDLGKRRLRFKPGSYELFIANGSQLFARNTNGIDTWNISVKADLNVHGNTTITDHAINEIDFHPTNPNIAIISPYFGMEGDLLLTTNAGSLNPTWSQLPIPPVVVPINNYYRMDCSASFLNGDYIFVGCKISFFDNVTNNYTGISSFILRYDITNPALPILFNYTGTLGYIGPNSSTFTELTAINSPFTGSEQVTLIFGTTQYTVKKYVLSHSPTTSITFSEISAYSGVNTHTDIRDMVVINNTSSGPTKLYIGSDGGVSKCDDAVNAVGDANWISLNGTGLTITEFLGFNASEAENYNIMLGSPDGNNYIYNTKTGFTEETFRNYPSGDGYDAVISKIYPNKAIHTNNGTGIRDPSNFSRYNILGDVPTGVGVMETPKSEIMPCSAADCKNGTCPDPEDCRETNFALKPFSFELDNEDFGLTNEYFYTGTSDVFRVFDPFTGTPSTDYDNLSKTHASIDELEPGEDIITKNPITAYKRIYNDPFITTYYATKEIRNIGNVEAEDLTKIVKSRYNKDEFTILSEDITPHIDEDPSANTYNQLDYSWITDLVIDESTTNPDQSEIWVSFGSNTLDGFMEEYVLSDEINDPNKNAKKGRVYYSPDGGTTWLNKSNGLPNYPVLALVYWKGSNDIIFAGTDVGVYVWNKSALPDGAWECFGENLPFGSVNDLEIHYCTNTLRATIFGFGFWESPLPDLTYTTYNPQFIYGNVVWNTDKQLQTDIVVTSGAVLTIESATISMGANKAIKVNKGGRLVIDGATITNNCESFWYGIEVMGDKNLIHPSKVDVISGAYPASATDHGVVYLKNGATIQNSEKGVTASYRFLTTQMDENYNGGIIIAHDAYFINNIESASFYKFNKENIGEFYNCQFLTDNQFIANTFPTRHVYLKQTKGVLFQLNKFENTNTYVGPLAVLGTNRGKGIFSEESTFDVVKTCIEPGLPCGCNEYAGNTFNTLYRAIDARSIGYFFNYPLTIEGNSFYGNDRAVLISGMGNLKISSNLFEIPDRVNNTSYGLYLEGCTDYGNAENHLEDNTFKRWSLSSSNPLASCNGLFIANNSNTTEEVYRNYFENLDIGIRCQNNNVNLTLKCNTFTQPIEKYNIAVTSGIIDDQGTCGLAHLPAGNDFSNDCTIAYGDFYIQSGVPGIHYYHHTGYQPTCFSPGITLHDCGSTQTELSCPSQLPDPCGEEPSAQMMITEANVLSSEIYAANAVIDGGNTDELLFKIGTNNITETELAEIGPYLTDTVLNKIIETPVLTTNELINVVSDNSPISNNVATTLEQEILINPEIASLFTDSIAELPNGNYAIITSPMRDLNLHSNELVNGKYLQINGAATNFLINEQIDSAILLLNDDLTNWSKFKLADIYTSSEDYNTSAVALATITPINEQEVALSDYFSLINQIKSEGNLDSLTIDEKSSLSSLSSKDSRAGIAAINLLGMQGETIIDEIIDSIYETPYYKQLLENTIISNKKFEIFPNPAHNACYITIYNAEEAIDYYLSITNVLGNVVFTLNTTAYNNKIVLPLSELLPGIYFIEVKANNYTLGTEKLVIY